MFRRECSYVVRVRELPSGLSSSRGGIKRFRQVERLQDDQSEIVVMNGLRSRGEVACLRWKSSLKVWRGRRGEREAVRTEELRIAEGMTMSQ